MAVTQRTNVRDKRKRGKSPKTPLSFPLGVVIRDLRNRVYFLSLAELDTFRREDLEVHSVFSDMDRGARIMGLKNAWRIEGVVVKSGD